MGLARGLSTHLYMEIICTSWPKALPRNQISYIWKSDPEYLGTFLPTRKLPHIKGFELTLYHYINHKPYPFWGTWILPSSCTIEFLEILLSLTNLSKGLWSISHWCPLIGSFLLFFRYTYWHMCGWSTHWRFLCIISWRRLWGRVISHIAISKIKSCIVWHDQWPPLTKRSETCPTHWRGKCKHSPQWLNDSLNEKMS